MRVTFLGTGTSTGIPLIGCACVTCRSEDPRDCRSRASILLEWDQHRVVIDTSTDFRQQALRVKLDRLDAVLYTHAHADHIFGLDDLRPLNMKQGPIPCYCTEETFARLSEVFPYAFEARDRYQGLPWIVPHLIESEFEISGQRFLPLKTRHGSWTTTAYRFDGMAYLTDCNEIPPESLSRLQGLDVLVLDALRLEPHPTHLSLDQSLAYIEQLQPRQAYLTHMSHEILHEEISRILPPRVALAHDGLQIDL